jgi:prepilin peptidase CpaA
MLASFLICLFFAGILFAAINDVRTMTIPNWVSIAFTVLFLPAAFFTGMGWGEIGFHYLAGLIGFAVCIALYAGGVFGGGDAKLLPAVLVWLGPAAWLPYVYGIALTGGILALLIMMSRRFVPQTVIPGFLQRSVVEGPGIPYAVAIGLGAVWALPAAPLLQTLITKSGFAY